MALDHETEVLPEPTYAPAALAMACGMLLWGLLTHWSLSLAGGCLLAWALWLWLRDVARDWRAEE